jgi:transcription-repair coupling factor (superfamily II helicase)
LSEAIEELKENEFAELYNTKEEDKEYVKDTQLDSDFELLFPDNYINNISERLTLYNELSNIKKEEQLVAYETRLIDRFGQIPEEAVDLLNSVRLKWIATKMGLERLVLKQGKMIGYFIADQQSSFYQSSLFNQVLKFVQANSSVCKMKEKQTRNGLRLLLTFDTIKSVEDALNVLSPFMVNEITNK